MEAGNALLDEHALALTGVECPSVCFLPTASGDADHYIVRFYRAFPAGRCQPSHVSLFRRDGGAARPRGPPAGAGPRLRRRREPDLAARHLERARDRRMLRAAWEAGVVMAGLSAGLAVLVRPRRSPRSTVRAGR